MAETAQRRSPTQCIIVVEPERSEIQMFSNLPVLILRSLYGPRHLNLEVMSVLVCRVKVSWPQQMVRCLRPACFLEAACYVLLHYVMPCQATSRSLFTRRHLGTDEGFAGAPQASASGERHLCNSEFHQCNLIQTRWHFIWVNVLRQYTKNITEAATHTAAQVDDAHSSEDFVKRLLC